MRVSSDVIDALLPTFTCSVDLRFSALQRAILHANVGNNGLMTSELTRIDDMYETYDTLWYQPGKHRPRPSTRLALRCIRYFMQGKDVFRVIPGVFGITLENRGIFRVGIFTVLGW